MKRCGATFVKFCADVRAAASPPKRLTSASKASLAARSPVEEAALEARLAMLEQTVAGGPSKLNVDLQEQQLAELRDRVSKRMTGVRQGMEMLDKRLRGVETAIQTWGAKLPATFKGIDAFSVVTQPYNAPFLRLPPSETPETFFAKEKNDLLSARTQMLENMSRYGAWRGFRVIEAMAFPHYDARPRFASFPQSAETCKY